MFWRLYLKVRAKFFCYIDAFTVDSECSFLFKSKSFEIQKQIHNWNWNIWKCFDEAVFTKNKRHEVNLKLCRFEWTSLWLQPCFEDIWKIPAENIPDWVHFLKCFFERQKNYPRLFCFSCEFSDIVLNSFSVEHLRERGQDSANI